MFRLHKEAEHPGPGPDTYPTSPTNLARRLNVRSANRAVDKLEARFKVLREEVSLTLMIPISGHEGSLLFDSRIVVK